MKLRVVEQLVPRDNGRPAADITPASLRRKFAVVHCRYFAGTLIVDRWNIVARVQRGHERVSRTRPAPASIPPSFFSLFFYRSIFPQFPILFQFWNRPSDPQ